MRIESSEKQGRYVVSTTSLPSDSPVCIARCYSVGIIESYRKRVCIECLKWGGPYTLRCKLCDQVYYCSNQCFKLQKNHDVICIQLRKVATMKLDKHAKSIMRILLDSVRQHIWDQEINDVRKMCLGIVNDMVGSVKPNINDDSQDYAIKTSLTGQLPIIEQFDTVLVGNVVEIIEKNIMEFQIDDPQILTVQSSLNDLLNLQTHSDSFSKEDVLDWSNVF